MNGAPGEDPAPRPRRLVVLLFLVLNGCLLAGLLEGGARLWHALRSRAGRWQESPPTAEALEARGRALGLDPYEIADGKHPGHWRLRPGYRATVLEMLEAKRRAGRVLAVRYFEEEAPRLGLRPDDVAVWINDDGYRGPALDATHSQLRILSLGDSCTFGSPLSQRHGYTRTLERELRQRGFGVEVVNGGVEGYAPADVLVRIDEFRALRPEITTLYIGWNALYTERFLEDNTGLGRYLVSARLVGRAVDLARARWGAHRAALAAYERPKRPRRDAAEVQLFDDYVPSFLPEVERIVEEMQASGSRVVLITIPGLYATDRVPSPRALEIGHLPTFTDNPFVLARMAERYNTALRELARRRGLDLVDLDRWSSREQRPPDEHFIDSVHLDERSQERAGIVLADALESLVRASARPTPPAAPNRASPPGS